MEPKRAERRRGWARLIPVLFLCASVGITAGRCAGSPYAAFNRGVALIQKGKTEQAEPYLFQAVHTDAKNAEAWNQLGIIAYERQDWDEAELRFRKAYDLNRRSAVYPRNLAYVYAERKQYSLAKPLLKRSLELEPSDPETWTALAKIAFLQGRKPEAAATLRKALGIDPAYLEAIHLLSRLGNETK